MFDRIFKSTPSVVVSLLVLTSGVLPVSAVEEKITPQQERFFETKIRPVLVKHCYSCHSKKSKEVKGGLQLDTRKGIRMGGESGHAVVPGNVKESLLIDSLKYESFEMPPEEQLPEQVVNDFVRWIRMGAPDPRDGRVAKVEDPLAKSNLWSLQPIENPAVPQNEDAKWARNDVDKFIHAKHEAQNLTPVGEADRLTLLRRLHFDLTGLPPSPAELKRFKQDQSNDAVDKVIERLLNSPQFGERWGRHWLDVVRYAESTGSSRDVLMVYAWRYRDYVINAFNSDMPYDQFVREQIAGDLLPAENADERKRQTIATGLLAIGSKSLNGGNLALDIPDDQIDVISKSMMGLTVSCARCHDHKFDPIPTADYYAMAGIFRSTQTMYGGGTGRPKGIGDMLKVYVPLGEIDPQVIASVEANNKRVVGLRKQQAATKKRADQVLAKLPKNWRKLKTELANVENPQADDKKLITQITSYEKALARLSEIKEELAGLGKDTPSFDFALAVRDTKAPRDWPIQVRGDSKKSGETVARGFLSCVEISVDNKVQDKEQSGRLELANWITHPEHPLTARVAVNRVWQHLFGEGIVQSVDNFGVNATPPTHPELLDYLAYRFVHHHKWSIKSLVRELVQTRTYQMSSSYDAAGYKADAENNLLWRMNRRRMEAEPLRDFLLSCSGQLDLEPLDGSLVQVIGEGEVGRGINTSCLSEPFHHRTVYMPIIRGIVPEFLKLFDFPEPSNVQGRRVITTVPSQSLYLMNSPFVIGQAEGLAKRVLTEQSETKDRIAAIFEICLSRPPGDAELQRSLDFLQLASENVDSIDDKDEIEFFVWSNFCQAMFARAEFRYID